jgi:hypothetical protein
LLADGASMTLLRRTTLSIALAGFALLACDKVEDVAGVDSDAGGDPKPPQKEAPPPGYQHEDCGKLGPQPFPSGCERGEIAYTTTGYHGSCTGGCWKTKCAWEGGGCYDSCPSGRAPMGGDTQCEANAGGPICCVPMTDAGVVVDASPDA